MTLFFFVTLPTWLAIAWRRLFAREPRRKSRYSAVRSILVVRLDQLGDLMLTTPVFRELKRLYPVAKITAVVPQDLRAILATNRNVDEILSPVDVTREWVPTRIRTLLAVLRLYVNNFRSRKFDLCISPRWDTDESLTTLLCTLASAGWRVGFSSSASAAKQRANCGFNAAFDLVVPPGPPQHELDKNLAIVEALGGRVHNRRLDIRITDADRQYADELLTQHSRKRRLVALGIGGRAAGRRWPIDRYAEVIERLNEFQPVQPVVLCGIDEELDAKELSAHLKLPPYVFPGLPLRTVCAVLERCDLFIGNDSGPAHLAAASNCATIVVSRHPAGGDQRHPNSPIRFAPRCDRSVVIQPTHGLDECTSCCSVPNAHCILQITPQQVVETALGLMQRFGPHATTRRAVGSAVNLSTARESRADAFGLN